MLCLRILVLPLTVAAAIAVGSCGGGNGGGKSQQASERQAAGGGEEADRERALKQIKREDSIAFYQLSTTTGLLTARAAALTHGQRPPIASELAAATVRVRALAPRDADLQRLRLRLLSMLSRPPADGDRRAARATLAGTTALIDALARYTHAHQQYGALVPD